MRLDSSIISQSTLWIPTIVRSLGHFTVAMVAGEHAHFDFLPMQHSMLHGVDQIISILYSCTMRYICNRHTFYSDMHEQVHKVISIKDASITLDNDRIHTYIGALFNAVHYKQCIIHIQIRQLCVIHNKHSCCCNLTAQPATNSADWTIWVILL